MRPVFVSFVMLLAAPASAADLPDGALARLGDDRFRAGSGITHIALSPDGKQFATITDGVGGFCEFAVWDASTGRRVRTHRLHEVLLKGMVWGPTGGFAIVGRADRKGQYPDDFQVWKFSDPKADPPPELPVRNTTRGYLVDVPRPDPTSEYTAFHITPDARRVSAVLKTANGKYAAHVFDLKPAEKSADLVRVAAIDLGAEEVFAARLSPDGKTLVTCRILRGPDGWEYTATPWILATGKPQLPIRVPDRYTGLHQTQYERLPPITPDGRTLAVYSRKERDEWYSLLDLETGKPRELIRWKPGDRKFAEGQLLGECAFFPSGRVLLDAWTDHPTLIDTGTGKELGRLTGHASAPTAVAVSADETRIATADLYGLVRIWDARSLRPVADTPGHRSPVETARLSPDGKRLLTWARDGTVRLWDLATGENLRSFADASEIGAEGPNAGGSFNDEPTFTPDGKAVLYCTKLRLIARDLQTGLEVPLPGEMVKLGPRGAVFAPDGKAVLTWPNPNSENGRIEVWDWPTGKKRFAWGAGTGSPPQFSADGVTVFENAKSPNCCDAKTGKELPAAWGGGDNYSELVSLQPYPRLLVRYTQPEGEVINADNGKRVLRLRRGSYRSWPTAFWNIALSPTGTAFARASEEGLDVVNLYESATGEIRRTLTGHRGEVRVLGFTPDGTKLLTAGGDHTILVWDMRLAHILLPDAIKKESDTAKLWNTLATGNAKDAYLAMARLAREPDAAVKLMKLKLKPVAKTGDDTDASRLADARAVELLEAIDAGDARSLLKELAGGHADAFRTQEAKRALGRLDRR